MSMWSKCFAEILLPMTITTTSRQSNAMQTNGTTRTTKAPRSKRCTQMISLESNDAFCSTPTYNKSCIISRWPSEARRSAKIGSDRLRGRRIRCRRCLLQEAVLTWIVQHGFNNLPRIWLTSIWMMALVTECLLNLRPNSRSSSIFLLMSRNIIPNNNIKDIKFTYVLRLTTFRSPNWFTSRKPSFQFCHNSPTTIPSFIKVKSWIHKLIQTRYPCYKIKVYRRRLPRRCSNHFSLCHTRKRVTASWALLPALQVIKNNIMDWLIRSESESGTKYLRDEVKAKVGPPRQGRSLQQLKWHV